MLLEFGNTVADLDWQLNERQPTGYARVYYVREADILYEDAERSCRLLADHIYALPSAAPYRARRLSDKDFRCTYLHIDFFPRVLSGLIEMPVPPGSALERFAQTVETAIDEGENDLVRALAEVYQTVFRKDPRLSMPSGLVSMALNCITAHLSEEISIQRLGELSAYHLHYFIRLFKRETGLSPHQYIQRLCLREAAKLLRAGCSVSETAAAVGYQDANSFARAFKARYNLQPGRFAQDSVPIP